MQLRIFVERHEVNKALEKQVKSSWWEFLMLRKEDAEG